MLKVAIRVAVQKAVQHNLKFGSSVRCSTARPAYHAPLRCVGIGLKNRSMSTQVPLEHGNAYLASLKERGLYADYLFQHVKSFEVKEATISGEGKYVDITWGDNHKSRFHSIWLRHSCHCPECKMDFNGMVTINFAEIDTDITVNSFALEGGSVAVFEWTDKTGQNKHKGPIPLAWLRQHCYSEEADRSRREKRKMQFFDVKTIPEVEYKEVAESDTGLYNWLFHLSNQGICLMKNVPTVEGMVAKVAERIAPLQHSVYGETFDVVSTPKPINAAYSAFRLDLHMDQPHYESPPGLQMLHCLEFDPNIVGGDSMFADIHEIANILRDERPDYFNTLARVPFTFQTVHYDRDYPVHLQIQRPIITVNHKNELVAVTWHPMLVGALQVQHEDVEPFYEAYRYFYKLVNSYNSVYKLRLVPGDLISFNNRRVLHGRESYSNQTGRRFLQGTYVEISEFQSRVRVLHNKIGDGRPATRCGNFDWQ